MKVALAGRDLELKKLFSSNLFLIRSALQEVLGELFIAERTSLFEIDIPTYRDETIDTAKKLSQSVNLNITSEYDSTQIADDSIAFHRIKGLILAEDSWWRFTTKQFRADLLAADANPKIVAHFLAVNSGGGEAWFLDVAAETVKNLTKPVVAHYENVAASAAVYLSIYAQKIFAATANETIGSVGTMVSFLDIIPYFEALGAKYIEAYANQSDLKNKKFNDLKNGNPEQYIKEELDPLAAQFIETIKAARPSVGKLKEDHPVFRGETFDTEKSIEIGLIDGRMLMEDALVYTHNLGVNSKSRVLKIKEAFNSI